MVGGLGTSETQRLLGDALPGSIPVDASSDFDAAATIATSEDVYYLGSCHTGAGAALGVLVALLGPNRCHAFGRSVPTRDELRALIAGGTRVFGFPVDKTGEVVEVFVDVLAGSAKD